MMDGTNFTNVEIEAASLVMVKSPQKVSISNTYADKVLISDAGGKIN